MNNNWTLVKDYISLKTKNYRLHIENYDEELAMLIDKYKHNDRTDDLYYNFISHMAK